MGALSGFWSRFPRLYKARMIAVQASLDSQPQSPKHSRKSLKSLLIGRVSRVQAMDKALESIVVAALARFLSHVLVHLPLQSGQDLPPSCQKRETPYISMRFSSTAGISSMSLSTDVSVSYTFVANNQHELEETA